MARTTGDFVKHASAMALAAAPALASCRRGRAQLLTILHTPDIHAQLDPHAEFFYENCRPEFKRRGGFATLRRMLDARDPV